MRDPARLVQTRRREGDISTPERRVDHLIRGHLIRGACSSGACLLLAPVFYRTDPADPAYTSFVAIYIGTGKMVQAPRTGENVQIVATDTTVDFARAVRVEPVIAAALAG